MNRIGILGGGWAGLLAAHELKRLFPSVNIEVLEKEEEGNLGGLLRSEIIKGFTFDTGGPHILFSRNKDILTEIVSFLGQNQRTLSRKSFIRYGDSFLKYPFENGIYELDQESRAKFGQGIIESMLQNAKTPEWKPETFMQWIYGFFGKEMGEKYLEPYNRKIWKRDPSDMDASWVFSPGRLPFPNLEVLLKTVAGIETTGYAEQANFYYPRTGGINALYNGIYDVVKREGITIRTGVEVKNLKKNQLCNWLVNDEFEYESLLNTLALNDIPKFLDVPTDISNTCANLDYNSVFVTGIAVYGPSPYHHAVYVADSSINFHRYTWMSSLTTDTPGGKSNLISEVTVPKGKEINLEKNTADTVNGFLKLGVIKREQDIIFTEAWTHKFGYPVYTKNYQEKNRKILAYLADLGMPSVGRWGSWEYWNTDKVFEAVKRSVTEFAASA